MSLEFLTFLSRDFTRLLDNAWDYDIQIEVGADENTKVYQAHSLVLRARSKYFAAALGSEFSKTEDGISLLRKPDISPATFGIILRYIYGGMIHVTNYDPSELFDLLIAADELCLEDLFEYLQNHLINEQGKWIREHYAISHRIAFQHNSFWKLQQFINMIKDKHPETIFNSKDFSCLEEDMIISLLRRDDIALDESELWSRIMEWGLAQMPPFTLDIGDWRHNEFGALEKILHKMIPHIRFFHINSEDFDMRVAPFKPILPRRLFRDVVNYHLHPNDTSKIKSNIGQPRLGTWNWLVLNMKPPSIDSMLINIKHAALVAIWIDQKEMETNFVTNPFEFKLLLRGSRDGFTPTAFHRNCDNQGATLTVIKVKGTDELIGGYNPYSWNSHSGFERAPESFIFSMHETDLSAAHCSLAATQSHAIRCSAKHGPVWGDGDLGLYGYNFQDVKLCYARKNDYEKTIRDTTETFSVKEYEVFQIIKKKIRLKK